MINVWLRVALWSVRTWTAAYTWRLPPELRERRRAEIESDLWESRRAEQSHARLALSLTERLLLGMPDDVQWRLEQVSVAVLSRRVMVMCAAGAALLACVWLGVRSSGAEPPPPPQAPDLIWGAKDYPPPPPPPPPPCNPRGIGRPAFSPCTPYPH